MGLFTTEIESVSLDGQKHITIKRGFLFLRRLLEKKILLFHRAIMV